MRLFSSARAEMAESLVPRLGLRSAPALICLLIASLALPACGDATEVDHGSEDALVSTELSAKTELALQHRLPTSPELDAWYASVEELEAGLESGDPRYTLAAHTGGGTSAYVEVSREGKVIGAFLPENSATVPLGEVRAFQLARALGVPNNVGAGVFFRLKGKGLSRFSNIMTEARFKGPKEENRVAIVGKLKGASALLGVFKSWEGPRPVDYEPLAAGGGPNGNINLSDRFVKFLSARGPKPSAEPFELAIRSSKGTTTELDLAKQLSTLMLIDALNGQWDRFSGGNMHLFFEGGSARFVLLDNGGISTSGKGQAATYRTRILNEWVTRYDREVVKRLLSMNELVARGSGEALRFTDPASLRDALMMSDREWEGFKSMLADVAKVLAAAPESSFFEP